MKYNYSKLLGRIKEFGYTQESLAKKIGIAVSSMSTKLNNKYNFSQPEILKICSVLDIDCSEIGLYFFCIDSLEIPNKTED